MNEKFYKLPLEKQRKIIFGGYRIFGEYAYKKAPMSMIAEEAGISKALLFHYFINKKELYLFLFKEAIYCSNSETQGEEFYRDIEFFDFMKWNISHSLKMAWKYPYMYQFLSRAYYEKDDNVSNGIEKLKTQYIQSNKDDVFKSIDTSRFKCINDAKVLFDMITFMAEGYMTHNREQVLKNPEKTISLFNQYMDSLKENYYSN